MTDEIYTDFISLLWPAMIKGLAYFGLAMVVGVGIGGSLENTAALFAAVDVLRRSVGPSLAAYVPGLAYGDPSIPNPLSQIRMAIPWMNYVRIYLTQALFFGIALYALPALGLGLQLAVDIPTAAGLGIGAQVLTTLAVSYMPCIGNPTIGCFFAPGHAPSAKGSVMGKHSYNSY